MPTTYLRAQPLFSVPGLARLTNRAISLATLSRPTRLNRKPPSNPSTSARSLIDLDGKRAILELSSDKAENVSTPTRILKLAESDTNSDPEKPHFSETLGKYLTHLKTFKCPKIKNSELLVGIDRVSRSNRGLHQTCRIHHWLIYIIAEPGSI